MKRKKRNYYKHNKFLSYPAISVIIFIWIIPFIIQIIFSFLDYDLNNPSTKGQFVGLSNYSKLIFKDSFFKESLVKTAYFTFSVLIIETILGLFIAIFIAGLPNMLKDFISSVIIIPLVIAPFTVGLIWNFQFNPIFGPLSYYLNEWGYFTDSSILDHNNAFKAICFVDIWQNTPFMTLIFLSAISGVPKSVTESLYIHQVGLIKRVFNVYLKYLLPILIIAIFLRCINLIKTFDSIHILTQGGPSNITEILSIYLYRLSFKELNFGLGSAEGLVINYTILLVTLFVLKKINFYKL